MTKDIWNIGGFSVRIEKWQIEKAKKKSTDLGKLHNSIRGGKGNMIGFLGEILVSKYLGINDSNTYDYDLIYTKEFENKREKKVKLEVKTKERTVIPLPYFNATISDHNPNQECDFYIFVSIIGNLSKAYVCGIISRKEFFKKAKFKKKGEYDGKFTFKSDCYNLPYKELWELFHIDKIIE